MNKSNVVFHGMRDGLPIGLGYFAVAFSVGITAHNAGITAVQGFIMSMLNNASAGQYAGIAAIKANAPYWEIAILMLITNARYLLMSAALSQKLSPSLSLGHRMLIGFDITDELFGIGIAAPSPLAPGYMYGAYMMAIPMWASGTAMGIVAGNLLPVVVVKALSAAIFGMFIAVIIPPARENKFILAVILVSFAASSIFAVIPLFAHMTESFRIIILTLLISVAAAIIKPIKDESAQAAGDGSDGHCASLAAGDGSDGHCASLAAVNGSDSHCVSLAAGDNALHTAIDAKVKEAPSDFKAAPSDFKASPSNFVESSNSNISVKEAQ